MTSDTVISNWLKHIERELKISNWKELCKTDADGISIAPAYMATDSDIASLPAFNISQWDIVYRLPKSYTAFEANSRYINALQSGATAIWYHLEATEPKALFNAIECPYILNIFEGHADAVQSGLAHLKALGYTSSKIWVLQTQEAFKPPVYDDLLAVYKAQHKYFNALSCAMVSTEPYHALGATSAFEIAIGLTLLWNSCVIFTNSKSPAILHVAVTEQFFNQIAKLRAIHRIWNLWKHAHEHLPDLMLSASSSTRFYSALDADTNILRSAVSVLAAKWGGASAIQNTSAQFHMQHHDFNYEYVAIAQQLLMRDEMLMQHYADISCGSYFIEYYTDAIAEKALYWISEIQKQGGINKALQNAWVQTQINAQQQQQDAAFWNAQQFKIGINAFFQHTTGSDLNPKDEKLFPGYTYEITSHAT